MNADDEDFLFDVVIVGAGPSAAGLLRGLLQRSLLDGGGGGGSSGIRIAILERGGGRVVGGGGEKTKDRDRGKAGSRFDHPHPSTTHLSRWFEASHYSSTVAAATRECDDDGGGRDECDGPTTPQSPTVLHETLPNRATNYRVMDVPTGLGWGGTTNVHAGLVNDPIWSSSSSSRRRREASLSGRDRDDRDDDRDGGDFDVMWPGRWRGGEALRCAVREVRTALVTEEENGDPLRRGSGGEGGETDEFGAGDVEFRPVVTSSSSLSWASLSSMSSLPSSSSADSPAEERTSDGGGGDANEKVEEELAEGKEDGRGRRVNYFAALVEPLLRQHPELEDRVVFLPGMRAERILFDRTGRARGMECLLPHPAAILEDGRRRRVVVRSRGEIVLCAGAIGSPALLLASGVGHEDDLGEAGIVPWYDRTTTTPSEVGAPSSLSAPRADDRDDRGRPSSFHRTLPVGRNLRDHVLLPRVFVTPHRPLSRRWTFSRNSIRGTMTLNLPMNAVVGGSSSSTTTRDFCGRMSDRARIQLQLADGGQMDRMIPHFAAAAMRRWRWSCHCFLRVRGFLIRRLPFWDAARLAAINVCLMNPRSVGRVTIVCPRDDNDDDDDDGDNEEDRRECLSDPNGVAPRKCHTRSLPTRLSNCRVIIDPGYLTDPWDVDALYAGWRVSSEIKRHRFRGCTEILPGRFLATVFALASLASSLIGWLASHFWYGICVDRKERCGGVIGCMSDRPSWFSAYVAEFANPYYHWCGTCAMGEDATEDTDGRMTDRDEISSGDHLSLFVVDERLLVRGIVGLRICDASVFPACISAPTALTCAALGHAASTFILDRESRDRKYV